jgi:uncharacterized membrane protein
MLARLSRRFYKVIRNDAFRGKEVASMTHNQTRFAGALACSLLVFFFIFVVADKAAGFTLFNILCSIAAGSWAMLSATFALGEINN